MTYEQALAVLEGLIDFEKLGASYFGHDRFQLENVRRLLAAIGAPQTAYRIAHIAGTKGKGSTAAMLASILRRHSQTVGLFTQPHLRDIRERTRVNGVPIPREAFAGLTEQLCPAIEAINTDPDLQPITFYEAHLALTLMHFARASVDVAVIETGLGGRLDATNALSPDACAITRIDFDHTDLLGETLEEIATEKAGILKPGVPCVFAPQAPAVAALLADRASAVDAPVATFPSVQVEGEQDRFTIHAGATYHGLRLPLQGDHQRENAAVALALAELLATPDVPIRPDAVRRALAEVVWPGRFQVVDGHPTTVLDVAHNAISARVLREGLEQLLADRAGRLICVVGMAKDKDIAGFAETLLPIAAHVVCTRATSGRAADAEAIRAVAANSCTRAIAVDGVGQAIDRARDLAGPADVICVTGSFHVVGEAMEALDIEV